MINGEPQQLILDSNLSIPKILEIDLKNEKDPNEVAEKVIKKESFTSFILENVPLTRATIISFSDEKN